ncbi:MAG: putative porin [Bdellovibrionales bacterium]
MLSLPSLVAAEGWQDRILINGDLRFRGEHIIDGANEAGTVMTETERMRLRARARLQLSAKINSQTDLILRAATGSPTTGAAPTTNQDLTGYGSRKDFNLDLAYASWRPKESSQIWLGKTPIPFYQPGVSDLLFDSDFTPEGISAKVFNQRGKFKTFWNLALWQMSERHDSSTPQARKDVILVGGDGGLQIPLAQDTLSIGASYYNYSNIRGTSAGTAGSPLARGNTTTISGLDLFYAYKYELVRVFGDFNTSVAGTAATLYIDAAQNQDPDDENLALLYGVKFGKLVEPGNWSLSVDHRFLQKDSTVGLIADDGVGSGGTDLTNTRICLHYQIGVGAVMGLTFIDARRLASSAHIGYQRSMVDLSLSF